MDTVVVTSENLAEFNQQRLGITAAKPAESPAPASEPATEAPAEPAADAPAAEQDAAPAADAEPAESKPEEPKKPNKHPIGERLSDLTKQRNAERAAKEEAERRAQALEERVKALESGGKPKDPDAAPDPKDFSDAFKYAAELAKFEATKAVKAERDRQAKEQADREQNQKWQEWDRRVQDAKKAHTDFDEVVTADPNLMIANVVRDTIFESDDGPELLYHLVQNPDDLNRLNSMNPRQAVKELGKLSAKLTTKVAEAPKPEVSLSKAPPPINPLRTPVAASNGVGPDGEFHGSYSDYKRLRQAGKLN